MHSDDIRQIYNQLINASPIPQLWNLLIFEKCQTTQHLCEFRHT